MKFLDNLKSLSLGRQIALGVAVLAVIFTMNFLVRGAMTEPKALLYSGLQPTHAGEIIDELDKRGIDYEIRGEAIFIPQSKRDEVRFDLARQGLPEQSVQGYELLDDVNGFSVTSEMYNAAYWRAKEGELTRTILAVPGVSAARVHIGANLRSGFSRSSPAQTASVTLTTTHDLTADQAEAIQYMVSLAISGMNAEDVAVIDPEKGMLAGPNVDKMEMPSVVANSESMALEQKIMRLLEARVGPGNARVSVSVDVNRQRQMISEKTIDPQSRVIRSRTSNDVSETNSAQNGGAITASSNLPQSTGEGAGNSSTMKNSTESVAYEFNEKRTEVEMLPGEIQRISVAVLLNRDALGITDGTGDIEAASQQVISNFENLILTGAGLDETRGDSLTVELMPFQLAPAQELVTAPSMMENLISNYFWSGLQAVLLGIVIIVLALGVVRPMLNPKPAQPVAMQAGAGNETLAIGGPAQADPFNYLSDYTRERQDDTAALLQSWLEEDMKGAVNE